MRDEQRAPEPRGEDRADLGLEMGRSDYSNSVYFLPPHSVYFPASTESKLKSLAAPSPVQISWIRATRLEGGRGTRAAVWLPLLPSGWGGATSAGRVPDS